MSKIYVGFSSTGFPTDSTKCTTRWPDSISCQIPISGYLSENNTFHNLMILDGDETAINNWVNQNSGKVEVITKEQADQLGQALVVPGSENVITDTPEQGKETVMVAGLFDADSPESLWSVKEVRDMPAI